MDLTQLLETMKLDITSLGTGEKVFGGLVVTLLCMVIVFLVLIVLMFIVKAMRVISGEKKKTDEPKPEIITETKAPAPASAIAGDDDELTAVITAVLAAAEGSGSGLVVRSITRVPDYGTQWSKTYLSYKEDF
jgi:sodium pump decarboxylase gamma subunit